MSKTLFRWELLAVNVLVIGGLGGWRYGEQLPRSLQVLGACILAAVLVLLLRSLTQKLCGPVLFYHLVRSARRGRYFLLRCIYADVLLLVLWSLYLPFSERMSEISRFNWRPGPWVVQGEDIQALRLHVMSRFAEAFFSVLICVQLGAVALLTPAYAAGAIADEKDRKTLEFVLATDLRNREIVLGKLVACMANIGLLVLTGLPILSLLQLLGGVDPNLVLAGYAVTALTIVSLAAVSILVSVYAKKARDAIVLSYLLVFAYMMVSLVIFAMLADFGRGPRVSVDDMVLAALRDAIGSGNLVIVLAQLKRDWDANVPLTSVIPGLLAKYAVFHGLLALVCTTWAVLRLRAVALHTPRRKPLAVKLAARIRPRPRLGRRPMIWKEIFAEPGMAFGWFGKLIVGVIVFVSFAPPVWFVVDSAWQWRSRTPWTRGTSYWYDFSNNINAWVRLVGTTVATLTLLGVAVRAAGSVSGERDRQTLDSLLITQLEPREILYAKWLGSILSVRWAWVWLGFVWGIGMALGGLDVETLPWLLLIWLVYAAFFACLGQRFSITSSTTLQATLFTLASLALLSFGHWLPRLLWTEPRGYYTSGDDFYSWIIAIQSFGLTPPAALGWFAFHGDHVSGDVLSFGIWEGPEPLVILGGIAVGLVGWGLVAGWLWRNNQVRFVAAFSRLMPKKESFKLPVQELKRVHAEVTVSREGLG